MHNTLRICCILVSAFIIPSSGYVFLGKPVRGLLMLCWAFALGYITYQLTTPDISWPGRLSGGLAVWTLSILETWKLACMVKQRRVASS